MDKPAPTEIAILLVDDDRAFLDTVESAFQQFSGGTWRILATDRPGEVLDLLRHQKVDLAVLDVRMPGTDGLQLLQRISQEHAALPKVLLTSSTDPTTRLTGIESGAALFLEKPGSLGGLESVFATLQELIKWQRKQGARGAGRRAGLVEIVRLECASGNSRLIEVKAGETPGLIYIKGGSILHAESPGRRGQSAFTFLAAQPDPEFLLREFKDPAERSITRQWEFLVLEAFQLREQLVQAALEAKRKETAIVPKPSAEPTGPTGALQEIASAAPGRVEAPPPSPRRPAPPVPTTLRMVSLGPATVPSAPAAEAPPAAPAGVAPVEPVPPLTLPAPPAALALGTLARSEAAQVEEFVISTGQNEVLHEWHCLRADARLKAVEGLRQKAGHVQERIPLGATERVEFQGGDGRLVVRFQGDIGLVVRTTTGLRPMASTIAPFNLPFGDWVARHVNVRGLLACGLMRGNLILVSGSYSADLPSELLNLVWRSAAEAFELVRGAQFEPWHVRWIFEHGQLYWIRRLDGLALGLLLTKEAEGLDDSGVQRVYLEFCSLLSP